MVNVNSWNKTELDILVQAWSEVEAKYPLMRGSRNARALHAKLYALFSKRSKFTRTPTALERVKYSLRSFALFVKKFDEDRREDGGRLWFDLSVDEREQRRKLLPSKIRGLTSSVSRKAFATLLTMERAQRWLETAPTGTERREDGPDTELSTNFLSSLPSSPHREPPTAVPKDQEADEDEFSSLVESTSPSTGQRDEESEEGEILVEDADSSSMSAIDEDGDEASKYAIGKSDQGPQRTLKHRECNLLLENMVKLQNNKLRRAVNKLRADIEGEIQRSSEMLRSISSNQSDEEESGDASFVSKVLDTQLQQVQDRFDQFEEKQNSDEAANRALLNRGFQ